MEDNVLKFNKFEKIFFRINVAILGLSVSIYLLYLAVIENIAPFVDLLMSTLLLGMLITVVIFFLSVIRIIKYIVKHRSDERSSIWRSVINIFISPLSLIILNILIFATVLSSCTYAG